MLSEGSLKFLKITKDSLECTGLWAKHALALTAKHMQPTK